eukprot:6673460-Pyramimonas_sp.AAC.1
MCIRDSLREKLREALESDEFLLAHSYDVQYRRSLFVQLMEDYESSIFIPRLPDPCVPKRVQKILAEMISADAYANPVSFILYPRIKAWVPCISNQQFDMCFIRVLRAAQIVPGFIFVGLLKTIINSWSTKALQARA